MTTQSSREAMYFYLSKISSMSGTRHFLSKQRELLYKIYLISETHDRKLSSVISDK